MKTDKELLEEIEVLEKLESKGYKQKQCGNCNGKGYNIYPNKHGQACMVNCFTCDGKGYWWVH